MRNRRLWTGLLLTCLGMTSSVVWAQDLPEGPDQDVLAEDPPEDGTEEEVPESPVVEETPAAP
ncbi:MAG: hypothetical protein QGG40_10655, partial [Myxococcota bacterium]|nr:hypothetical protein [Myxococcota bacterium]